jgi:hypothetical protein
VIVTPREVFKPAIMTNAAAIIAAHYVTRNIMAIGLTRFAGVGSASIPSRLTDPPD